MNIFATIEVILHLVNLLVQYEPKLEADVRDILVMVRRMRDQVAADEGKK